MGENRIPSRVSWALIISLLLVVAFRLPYISRPFNSQDVAQIAYSASRAVEGQLLYRDTADSKPPLTLMLFALTFRWFGNDMTAVNGVAMVWALASTMLIFLLTHALFGRTAAGGAALFHAVFANSNTVNGTSPNYDFWMLPFMIAAVYCFVQGAMGSGFRVQGSGDGAIRNTQYAIRWLFAAGVCSGLGTLSKQHALFNFVALLNYVVFRACWDSAQRKRLLKELLLLGVGFVVAWLPFVLYFWSQGGLPAFIDSLSPRHNVSYMGTRTGADAWSAAQVQFVRQITRDTILWIFALIGLVSLLVSKKRSMGQWVKRSMGQQAARNTQYALFLWLWAFWSLVGVCITKRFYDHYFQQIIPVWSVLAGYIWGLCFDAKAAPRQAPRWTIVTVIAFGFLWSGRQSFRAREMLQRTHALLSRQHEPTELEEVGDYIRTHSMPQDTLYVWGWKPEIYYFADRKAPTKWWEWGIESGMWSQIAPEFERNKPKFIVVNGTLGGPPEFQDYVQRHYEPDTQIAQFQILRRRLPSTVNNTFTPSD